MNRARHELIEPNEGFFVTCSMFMLLRMSHVSHSHWILYEIQMNVNRVGFYYTCNISEGIWKQRLGHRMRCAISAFDKYCPESPAEYTTDKIRATTIDMNGGICLGGFEDEILMPFAFLRECIGRKLNFAQKRSMWSDRQRQSGTNSVLVHLNTQIWQKFCLFIAI